MKLPLDGLGKSPEVFVFRVERAWWEARFSDLEASGIHLLGEPTLETRAHALGENVHVEGELSGSLDAECARCTRRYRHALRDSFRLILAPLGEADEPDDPEGALALAGSGLWLGEDLETGRYRGSEIELDGFFAEVISLAIPMQPLCDSECPGLCPVCGTDLSQENCSCEDTKPDSPFAALAALRGGREGSP
ncbi:MAG: DUF177 domain-containing protein [Myxococcota bacterium]|nr:DUF177 domain-containing protein [Myxococcota bacterium]